MGKLSFELFKKRFKSTSETMLLIPYLCLDICFRSVFGSRGMEDVLLSLVNSVLRNAFLPTVAKLELRNPYVLRRFRKDKEPIIDVRATDEEGNVFDVEMQVIEHADFDKRAEYYGSRLLVDQIGSGSNYGDLRRVVSIYFVLFPIRKEDENCWFDVWRRTSVYDQRLGNDLITTIFVRLPTKSDQKPQGFVDPELQDWVTMFGFPFLTTKEQVEALEKKRPIFKKAGDKMGYFFMTESGRKARDLKERIRRDWYVIKKFAEEQGEERGEERGLERGLEQGKAQGKVEAVVFIVKSRFPEQYSKSSEYVLSRLDSKSIPELNELLEKSLNCASFQDFTNCL